MSVSRAPLHTNASFAFRGVGVLSLTLEARQTLCNRFGFTREQLTHTLMGLGARTVRCEDTPGGALDREARALINCLLRGSDPFLTHICPRWKTSMLLYNPSLLPRFPQPARPFAATGIAVVGCPVRKASLMASQPGLNVLTVREISGILVEHGARPQRVVPTYLNPCQCRLPLLIDHARAMCGEPEEPVFFQPGAVPGVEEASFELLGRTWLAAQLRFPLTAPSHAMEELVFGGRYAMVEPLSCWSAC